MGKTISPISGQQTIYIYICVCVCVRVTERERERDCETIVQRAQISSVYSAMSYMELLIKGFDKGQSE
jgi:hypothetical protein